MNESAVDVNVAVSRIQYIVPALLVLALAATVAWISFTREPADAFLFPRLISGVMLLLALWNAIRALRGLSRVGGGVAGREILTVLPGILIICVLVFYAAKTLGFYCASTFGFFTLYTLYDPASHGDWRSWLKRIVVTLAFMGVIYLLFTVLLKVQTPRGLYF